MAGAFFLYVSSKYCATSVCVDILNEIFVCMNAGIDGFTHGARAYDIAPGATCEDEPQLHLRPVRRASAHCAQSSLLRRHSSINFPLSTKPKSLSPPIHLNTIQLTYSQSRSLSRSRSASIGSDGGSKQAGVGTTKAVGVVPLAHELRDRRSIADKIETLSPTAPYI